MDLVARAKICKSRRVSNWHCGLILERGLRFGHEVAPHRILEMSDVEPCVGMVLQPKGSQ